MRRFLAARVDYTAACVLLMLFMLLRPAGAQTWNDPRSRALVEGATQRRAEQLADTALRDYQAVAHGYVAFLAQLGEGFRTPPKVIKTDELEDEVYWRAPNLSKQRIVGRRDTLLLPTDIAYHADHLGIVQNNFPAIIRIGDGDEVADVPHPLSPIGLQSYDFALADSFSIGSGAQRIHVYEVRVRPKDDQKARVVGAVYIDQASRQVVRMNLTFTRAALLDKSLEELSVVLENRLVGGRFWLPSRQEIEIQRGGEWLDFPARGIIRGRWEIGDYKFNQELPTAMFAGPEFTTAPPQVLAMHKWTGRILDSLPPDVLALSSPDIQQIQQEARAIVRARALATARRATLSARRISDFARFDRVEGLALGLGAQQAIGSGWTVAGRGRYGIDDKQAKGYGELSRLNENGSRFVLFGQRDFRDVGDVVERSSVVNSLAAQEFGSDYTDPFMVESVGARFDFAPALGIDARLTGEYERESPVLIHATPVVGTFEPTIAFEPSHAARFALDLDRPLQPSAFGSDLGFHLQARARIPTRLSSPAQPDARTLRLYGQFDFERNLNDLRLVGSASGTRTIGSDGSVAPTELSYIGGPITAPGFEYHAVRGPSSFTAHSELRIPAPFPSLSLGRYGRVPARAMLAPFAHVAHDGDWLPALGAAYILPFDLVRIDVAHGFGRRGRWTFNVDLSREFWRIL
jgi:hypothetical protein